MSYHVDPSFKSKRYRDKLRAEVKELETLLPVDRPILHRKLDSQAVYRIVIAYLRCQAFIKRYRHVQTEPSTSGLCDAMIDSRSETSKQNETDSFSGTRNVNNHVESWEELAYSTLKEKLLEGFVLVASVDGTIIYVTETVQNYTGFNQVDLLHRCLYSIVHPMQHSTVRNLLEQDLFHGIFHDYQVARKAFFCRMRCFQNNAMEFSTFHCTGKILVSHDLPRTQKTSGKVVLLCCCPFVLPSNYSDATDSNETFWTKHDLDLSIKISDDSSSVLGYTKEDLKGVTLYHVIHPEDTYILEHAHKAVLDSTAVQTIFLRLVHADGRVRWVHSKGKVISKNSKKFSIVFTHCPVRDEGSVFLKQKELYRRNRRAEISRGTHQTPGIDALSFPVCHNVSGRHHQSQSNVNNESLGFPGECPSSWHMNHDRHSPLLPSTHLHTKAMLKEKCHRQCRIASDRDPAGGYWLEERQISGNEPPAGYCSNFQGVPSSKHVIGASNRLSNNVSFADSVTRDHNASPTKQRRFKEAQTLPLQYKQAYDLEQTLTPVHSSEYPCVSFLQNPYSCFQQPQHITLPYSQVSPFTLNNGLVYTNQPQSNTPMHSQDIPNTCANIPWNLNARNSISDLPNCCLKSELNSGSVKVPQTTSVYEGDTLQGQSVKRHCFPNANVKFSMVCNGSVDFSENIICQNHNPKMNRLYGITPSANIKRETFEQSTCVHNHEITGTSRNGGSSNPHPGCNAHQCVKYDIEASFHMRIVESSSTAPDERSIGISSGNVDSLGF